MGSRFINGAKYAVSTQLALAVAISALSNGDPAVATAAALPANGDVVVVDSGWTELSGVAVRVANAAAGTFQLEEVDTTDTTRFPPGEGIGTYRIASGFTSLTQVRNVEVTGGEQNFFNYQYVEDPSSQQRQKPTSKNPQTTTITMDYDPNLGWYDALIELDRKKEPVVLRETLPGGDVIYYHGYLSFQKNPTKTINENMTVVATFSLLQDPIRYGA